MDEIDEEYITLQREILRTQGQNWFLNIHGWNDKNHSLCKYYDKLEIIIGQSNIAFALSPSEVYTSTLLTLSYYSIPFFFITKFITTVK